jgi:hypothetical protein
MVVIVMVVLLNAFGEGFIAFWFHDEAAGRQSTGRRKKVEDSEGNFCLNQSVQE